MLLCGIFPDIIEPPNGLGRSRITTGIFDIPHAYNIWLKEVVYIVERNPKSWKSIITTSKFLILSIKSSIEKRIYSKIKSVYKLNYNHKADCVFVVDQIKPVENILPL